MWQLNINGGVTILITEAELDRLMEQANNTSRSLFKLENGDIVNIDQVVSAVKVGE